MKRLILALCLFLSPLAHTGCQTTPSTQSTEARTLAALGATAKAGMDACTQLLKGGHITVAEYLKVAAYFDNRWQPAFTIAVNAAHGANLGEILASPDLLALAAQFSALVNSYASRP